jgi:3-dehydroquinate dehydratase-2
VKIIIINGPNLNLLGKRETNIYGNESFESYFVKLKEMYSVVELEYYQSNVEGEIINKLQEAGSRYDGIKTPVIEVHISNIYAREEYRHISLTGKNCKGVITGFGLDSYRLALEAFLKNTE